MKIEFETNIKSIVESSGGVLIYGNPMKSIETITTDSRDLGRNNFFIPLAGEKFDGHDYIRGLAEKKEIAGFMTMREGFVSIAEETGVSAVLCDDTLAAFGRIASAHRREMGAVVIAVTGTNGKTTTKEMLASALGRKYSCLKNDKNYNNEIGVPYTLLALKKEHKYAVIEMGMNHTGEIDRLTKMAKPDLAIITNVGEGHLEFLGSVKNVACAKAEIMNGMSEGSIVFLNRDTQFYEILRERALDSGLTIRSFGLREKADVMPEKYEVSIDNIRIYYKGDEFVIPLYGIHNLYNALAVIAVAYELNIEPEILKDSFNNFRSIDMRSQVLYKGYIIINDTYNSNPLSSRYALESVREIFEEKRKIAVLADMKELGDTSDFYHRELGKQVFENGFDMLCTYGESAADIAKGAKTAGMNEAAVRHFEKKNELVDFILKNITHRDVVLVKGSRSMKMEEVVEAIVH